MNCDKVQDLLSEAIDGTLPASHARRFQDHLAACPPCRMLFADTKDALALLADVPAIEPSPGFDDAVFARVRAERRAESPGFLERVRAWRDSWSDASGWMRWTPLAAATALLVWVATSRDSVIPDEPVAGAAGAAPAEMASAGEFSGTTDAETTGNPDLAPVDFAAPMPVAIEVFLESERDLPTNPERYRRSNYHYPLRAVRDPLSGPVVPVSGGVVRSRPTTVDPGVPVLTF